MVTNNPYLTTQNNFSGTGGTTSNTANTNPYLTTQNNFSGSGGTANNTADLENVMSGTMGGGGYTGPSLDDIQNMMSSTMGNYATNADIQNMMSSTMGNYATNADIEAIMANTMGNYATNADIEAIMAGTLGGLATNADIEATMASTLGGLAPSTAAGGAGGAGGAATGGGAEVGPTTVTTGGTDVDVGGTTVNLDLGPGEAPGMTQGELSQFLGQDPSAYLASQGGDAAAMDVDGDGTVTPAELEAYQGNVYQFDMPDAALSGVTDLNQMAIDYLSGTGEIPAIGNFMDDLSLKHERQAADLEQSIVNRGITDSSIADRMRADLSRNQTNESAMLETNLMQQLVPLYSQTGMGYEALTDQDRAQSLGEFFQFLDRQTAENRWTDQQKSQALSLMLNAMGMGTINPQMPAFNIPAGQPGAGQSIGQLFGNLGAAYLQGGGPLPSWLRG